VQFTDIGVVSSIEVNHKVVDMARKGEEVCIKIEASGGDAPRLYGRHFDHTDTLVSKVNSHQNCQ
jgi:translation initiation factor 5B